MTPHEQHYPRGPNADVGKDWGTTQLLIGIAAVAVVGILVLTSTS